MPKKTKRGDMRGQTLSPMQSAWAAFCAAIFVGFVSGGVAILIIGNIVGTPKLDDGEGGGTTIRQVNITMNGATSDGLAGAYLKRNDRGKALGHLPRMPNGKVDPAHVPASVLTRADKGRTYVPLNERTMIDPRYLPSTIQLSSERGIRGGTAELGSDARLLLKNLKQKGGPQSTTELGEPNGYCPVNTTTGKIDPEHLPASLGMALRVLGLWNPLTNVPFIASGVGKHGDMYIVSTSGEREIDGDVMWYQGNAIVFDTHVWVRVSQNEAVVSVNGASGVVSLGMNNLADVDPASSPPDDGSFLVLGSDALWHRDNNIGATSAEHVAMTTYVTATEYVSGSESNAWWAPASTWSGVPTGQEANFQKTSSDLPDFSVTKGGLYFVAAQLNLEIDSDQGGVGMVLLQNGVPVALAMYHLDFGCDANDSPQCHFPYWINTALTMEAGDVLTLRMFTPDSDTLRLYRSGTLFNTFSGSPIAYGTGSCKQSFIDAIKIA